MTLAAVHADAVAALGRWAPADPGQEALRHAFLAFLAARADAVARSCAPGHLTASALVVSADGGSVLLTLHRRVAAWLQLGGHCEEVDGSLVGAALREATEESGVAGLVADPAPLDLDVHPITCSLGVPTRHLDVRFLLRAPVGAREVVSEESDELRWWPIDAVPAPLRPMALRAGDRLRAGAVTAVTSPGSPGG